MIYEEITKDIVGAAMTVLNALKPGLDEKLYENALVIELRSRGHTIQQQLEFPVHYRGELIGRLIPDLIVDEKVIADPKVVTDFNDAHGRADARLLEHHQSAGGVAPELQRIQTGLEAYRERTTE